MESTYEVDAVLFERDHGEWVAQCLQYDIGAQASNITDLLYELQRAVVGHIVIALENGLAPLESLPAAPREYWDMWEKAKTTVASDDGPPAFRIPISAPRVVPRLKLAA